MEYKERFLATLMVKNLCEKMAEIEKNTIKSQDSLIDCNNGKRSSETLIETISKLETTIEELERTKKQLEIAVNGLRALKSMTFERYLVDTRWGCVGKMREKAEETLKQIEELEK